MLNGTLEGKEVGRTPEVLRAEGLTYRQEGEPPALAGLDLAVGVGEVVAIVGPKGCGKSTLLRVLAGELAPSTGTLDLPARRSSSGRLMLGYSPVEGAHFESLTGRENALFFARAAGLRKREARATVDEHLRLLGLKDVADRPVGGYGASQRRKLLLVEALAHRPALTLLDRPFDGLDAPERDALIHTLRVQSAKRGSVVVANDAIGVLPELADRLLFMHEGRIVAGGRVAELLTSVGPTTRIEIELDRHPEGLEARFRAGVRVVSDGDPLVLESPRGQAAVGEICGVLLAAGAVIRSVTVREADLAEVFRRVTGAEVDA